MKQLTTITRGSVVACFLALLLGTLILAMAGRLASQTSSLHGFTRFHQYINPTSFYYPTASQVVALAREASEDNRIVVVIGGSSVMLGAGQSNAELWSHALQRKLGDRYRVLNLALPSGSPQEHGSVAFQYLVTRAGRVIYLTDVGGSFNYPDGLFYPYVYWDAYYRGYLVPNPDAMPVIEQLSPSRSTSPTLEELKLRAALDSVLSFSDLWNVVGYRWAFTTWSYLVVPPDGYWFAPRSQFTDTQAGYTDAARYAQPPYDVAMDIVRGSVQVTCTKSDAGLVRNPNVAPYWSAWEELARAAFPESVRPQIVMTQVMHARKYRDGLSADELRCYTGLWDETNDRLHALGYGAMVLGRDWTAEDHVDVVHPSAEGGVKMATELAAQVQDLAGRLGYLEGP